VYYNDGASFALIPPIAVPLDVFGHLLLRMYSIIIDVEDPSAAIRAFNFSARHR
jgi:hypothetical protein